MESRQRPFMYPETDATGDVVNGGASCFGARVTGEAKGLRVEGGAVTGDRIVGNDAIGAEVVVMIGAFVVNRTALGAVVVGREVSESPVDGEGVNGARKDTVGRFWKMETSKYFGVDALAAVSAPMAMV